MANGFIVDGSDQKCQFDASGVLKDHNGAVVRAASSNRQFQGAHAGDAIGVSVSRVEDFDGHQVKDSSGANAKLATSGALRDGNGNAASTALGPVMCKTWDEELGGWTNWAG